MSIRQQTFLDYAGFVDKFRPKKTKDDCYTPPNIYEAVKKWAVNEYHLEGREIVRPFWPGADFEAAEYPDNCVVIDNPPFSIMSRIVKWYAAQGIDYFLFAPYLTNFGIGGGKYGVNHIITPVSITYENGVKTNTSFVTNLGVDFICTAPDLMDAIQAAEDANAAAKNKTLPKYEYPCAVITSAKVGWFCKHHTPYAVKREDCVFIHKLDAQGAKCSIYGGGYLLSERAAAERAAAERAAAERAAAERAAAERAAAERAAAERWELSAREIAMQKLIGSKLSNHLTTQPPNHLTIDEPT